MARVTTMAPYNVTCIISLSSATIFSFGWVCDRPQTVSQAWHSKGYNFCKFRFHISLVMKSSHLFFNQFFVRFLDVGNLSTLKSL